MYCGRRGARIRAETATQWNFSGLDNDQTLPETRLILVPAVLKSSILVTKLVGIQFHHWYEAVITGLWFAKTLIEWSEIYVILSICDGKIWSWLGPGLSFIPENQTRSRYTWLIPALVNNKNLSDYEHIIYHRALSRCNPWPEFPEVLGQNHIGYHWLNVPENSDTMHCGILFNHPLIIHITDCRFLHFELNLVGWFKERTPTKVTTHLKTNNENRGPQTTLDRPKNKNDPRLPTYRVSYISRQTWAC